MITFRRLRKLGRFGNQMFQYAGTRLYAELNGFSSAFPSWDGNRIFQLSRTAPGLRLRLLPTIQLSDMSATSWSERLLSPFGLWKRISLGELYAHPRDNISLYGYLQDDIALEKLRAQRLRIRSWFRFRPEIERVFRSTTDQYRPWLAAHIRRGDMIRRGKETRVSDVASHVRRLRENRTLFIASDDTNIGRFFQNRIILKNPLPELPSYAFDFWMLKEADILIGSGSTFAWWAAFLGQSSDYWSPPLNRTWAKSFPLIERNNL